MTHLEIAELRAMVCDFFARKSAQDRHIARKAETATERALATERANIRDADATDFAWLLAQFITSHREAA